VLDKKLIIDSKKDFIPNQTFNSKQIEFGKPYTIRELMKYMIAYSDNNATYLLNKNVDLKLFKKIFTDLNLAPIDLNNKNFKMNVKDYSMFIKIIYNSSLLSIDHSEFAAELLAQCDFKEGMVKGLPEGIKIAHKFGEMGDATSRQLHETGIIYIKNTPFLLTIMTKGYDVKKLPTVISEITKLTYQGLTQLSEVSK
jgi:beta-lactamase class A